MILNTGFDRRERYDKLTTKHILNVYIIYHIYVIIATSNHSGVFDDVTEQDERHDGSNPNLLEGKKKLVVEYVNDINERILIYPQAKVSIILDLPRAKSVFIIVKTKILNEISQIGKTESQSTTDIAPITFQTQIDITYKSGNFLTYSIHVNRKRTNSSSFKLFLPCRYRY